MALKCLAANVSVDVKSKTSSGLSDAESHAFLFTIAPIKAAGLQQ